MYKAIIILASLLSSTILIAQYDAFSFQALILDENTNPIGNTLAIIRTTISYDIDQTNIYYQEEQSLNSNSSGTLDFSIGKGDVLQGSMSNIDWLSSVPYISIAYDLRDGNGWQETGVKKFRSVPFCLESRYVVCQDGAPGLNGQVGSQGIQGPAGPAGSHTIYGPTGPQGPQGPTVIIPYSSPPAAPQKGRVYLDDGSNTADGKSGFRYYDGSGWMDL